MYTPIQRVGLGRRLLAVAAVSATLLLAACGGGDSPSGGGGTPTPPPSGGGTDTCSLSARQDWVRGVLNEWYLFPDLLASADPASFNNLDDYLDARVAPARAQSRDRFFTFATSIAEENALINSGSSAGFGIRLGFEQISPLSSYCNAT